MILRGFDSELYHLKENKSHGLHRSVLIMGSARTEMAAHIDVHFHALPPAYKAAVSAHGGDPSGFPEPEWSPEAAVQAMEALGSSLGNFDNLLLLMNS